MAIPCLPIGEVLRGARETAGLTQAEVASALNVTRTSLAMVEAGRHGPTFNKLIAWCRVLGVAPWVALRRAESRLERVPGATTKGARGGR